MKQSAQNVIALFVTTLAIIAVGSVIMSTQVTVAKNDNSSEKSEKTEKKAPKENKKTVSEDDSEKMNNVGESSKKIKGQENGSEKAKGKKMDDDSYDAAEEQEKQKRQEKITQEISAVVEENEMLTEEIETSIGEVESRNKFQKMLVGTDYKNLGQLRSSLVKNRNQIRKLTQSMAGATLEDQLLIEAQLLALTQERDEIKAVITKNEDGFSVLGWAFRLINGYPSEPIDENAEDDLAEEIQEAIDVAHEEESIEDEIENEENDGTENGQ